MTKVYVTQTGQRYHARSDLACLERANSVAEIDLATAVAGGLVPCLVCDAPPMPGVSEGDARWLRTIDGWAKADVFESFWEQAFVRRVLAQLPQLSSDEVEPQSYVTINAESYKVDFLIPTARVVLEIDGYAKDGSPPTSTDVEKRNRRDSALQSAGYKVLHFSNAQVQQEPAACRSQVAAALASATPPVPTPAPVLPPAAAPPRPLPPVPTPDRPVTPAQMAPPGPTGNRTGVWVGVGVAVAVIIATVAIVVAVTSSPGSQAPTSQTTASEATIPGSSAAPVNQECPAGYPYKGNESDSGELIVHAPGQQFYDRTDPEMCFDSLAAAEAAGFRAAKQ